MRRFVNPDLLRSLEFAAYRYRFLFIYLVIGVLSLCLEVVILRELERLGVGRIYSVAAGVISSILFAYWGNVRFNFKVPIVRRRRALAYFIAISFFSGGVQFLLSRQIHSWGWSYEQARFLISGGAFGIAYALHRRFSFKDFKKVGVAVYANGIEDIKSIHARIGDFADIIHVDLVDATYGPKDIEVRTYRLEVIRAYWPRKPIHVHLMSRRPSRYLEEIFPHVDRIYVHLEIDEEVGAVIEQIRNAGKEAGLAVALDTPLEEARGHLEHVRGLLVLAILKPGSSGQTFQMTALERVIELNGWPERSRLDICVDGGITEANVGLLNAEIVVSGSSVLKSADPRRQIMRLQTSSSYERT